MNSRQNKGLGIGTGGRLAHPASTDPEIAELKRKKLRIKDEITKLEDQMKLIRTSAHRPML